LVRLLLIVLRLYLLLFLLLLLLFLARNDDTDGGTDGTPVAFATAKVGEHFTTAGTVFVVTIGHIALFQVVPQLPTGETLTIILLALGRVVQPQQPIALGLDVLE
jgi:hypothetical protein